MIRPKKCLVCFAKQDEADEGNDVKKMRGQGGIKVDSKIL